MKDVMKKAEDLANLIEYDDKTCEITINGKFITTWNDEAHCDYPEDLTWSRTIGSMITETFKAGYTAALSTKTDKVQGLIDALKSICGNRCAYQNPCEARDALEAYQTDEGEGV